MVGQILQAVDLAQGAGQAIQVAEAGDGLHDRLALADNNMAQFGGLAGSVRDLIHGHPGGRRLDPVQDIIE